MFVCFFVQPFWLSMRLFRRNAWCPIFSGDTFYFYLLIFQYGVFLFCHCLGTGWFFTGAIYLAPSWVCLLCLTFLVHMFLVLAWNGMCHFSSYVNVVIVTIWLIGNRFCHPIRWQPKCWYNLYLCCLFNFFVNIMDTKYS